MVEMYQFWEDKQHEIAERVRMELNQVLQDKLENTNQPRFLQRLNWVELIRDAEELISRSKEMIGRFEAIKKAHHNICSISRSHLLDQGISIPDVSSTDDKKN
ncbi:uncharacterized protein [Lolium perenne]|uniref:uncharacterized protein n=1 Tax=Lolium perenne TaxID=4522 RepID=UPI003A992982